MNDKRVLFLTIASSMALFMTAETALAIDTVPTSGGTGVVSGNVSLPAQVYVSANKDDGASQSLCGVNGTLADITDMNVEFETKTSGVVEVLFCGSLDNLTSPNPQVAVRALVDSSPGNDTQCQPGNIVWEETGSKGGASCFTWYCYVENLKNCGKYHNKWCPTQHTVKMQCAYNQGDGYAQFNERVLTVRYDPGSYWK